MRYESEVTFPAVHHPSPSSLGSLKSWILAGHVDDLVVFLLIVTFYTFPPSKSNARKEVSVDQPVAQVYSSDTKAPRSTWQDG